MKTAIVHEWLIEYAGAESMLDVMYELFPSPIYTLIKDEKMIRNSPFKDAEIHTSSLQKIPFITKIYRKLLALFPQAIEEFDLSKFEVVLSSSHSVAKGVLTNTKQLHICYIHTPIRYAWDLQFQYLNEAKLKGLKRKYATKVLHKLRQWDIISANRVDHFIANSKYIAKRVNKIYRRKADVIYPPVNVNRFELTTNKENYYLTASRMVPYKKMALIAESFVKMPDKKLVIIGDGTEMKKIKAVAKHSPNIEILGYQPFDVLKENMSKAKAFLFAAEEDFGIIPVEAQACGTPVIAFGQGGALETVVDKKTGIFFDEQTTESIQSAVARFEKMEDKFDYQAIRKHSEGFSRNVFAKKLKKYVEEKYKLFEEKGRIV